MCASGLPLGVLFYGGGTLIEKVKKLDVATNPWRHSVREIIALNFLQTGDKKKAKDIFLRLVNDKTTPSNISTRGREILGIIE